MQEYEQQLERLKKALKVESDTAFSQLLEMSQGSVSGAKKRGQIPYAWFFQVAEKTNISLDWLFWGDGSMRQRQASEQEPAEQDTSQIVVERTWTLAGMQAQIKILEDELSKAKDAEKSALFEAKEAYKMAFEAARAEVKAKDANKSDDVVSKGDSQVTTSAKTGDN